MARILVVDDERGVRVTLGEFLSDAGYEVCVAEAADEAMEMLAAAEFDVVVSDIILPRKTGLALLEAIRETSPHVQVILMTGEPTVETASAAVRAGALDYLAKPIPKESFLRAVANAVKIKTLEDDRRRLEKDNRQYRENLEHLVEVRTAAWRESEERMELAVRGANLGTWDWNLRTGKRTVDERWAAMLGYAVDEIETDLTGRQDLVHPDDLAVAELALEAHLAGETDFYETEVRMRHKSGDWVWVLDKGRVLEHDSDGKPLRICGTHLDVTPRKKAEEGLRELQEHAHEVQKMEAIGTLSGGIAHDFNNILQAVIGYIDLAKETVDLDSKPFGYLSEIQKACSRASHLVAQMLAISRPVAHELKPIKLDLVVEEALSLLRESIPTTITFQLKVSPDCGVVLADASKIHQVTMNLCTNAYHAMREHGGTLTVRLEETHVEAGAAAAPQGLGAGRYVRLVVRDTGHGMDEGTMARIFEPYFTTKEGGDGTGLGLATVLAIVKEHGGVVTVQSKLRQGSTFEVYFPLRTRDGELSEIGDGDEMPVPSGRGEHILFVDDELAIVTAYAAILRGLGYEVTACTGSAEALEAFRANPDRFDLVITDQTMPHQTGMDVAKEMLRIRPSTPIFLCTGYSATVDETVALAAGLSGYLRKPINPGDLARTIRLTLDEIEKGRMRKRKRRERRAIPRVTSRPSGRSGRH